MPSKRLRRYIDADKRMKDEKTIVDAEKPYVKKLLSRCKRLGVDVRGVKFYERESVKLNEDEIFEHVKRLCTDYELDEEGCIVRNEFGEPNGTLDEEKFTKFCKLVIDMEKLELVSEQVGIEVLPLPAYCYKIEVSEVVSVDHKRV